MVLPPFSWLRPFLDGGGVGAGGAVLD